MRDFTAPLEVTPIGGGRWRLLREFSYYTEDGEWVIVVPRDFITDFASIPRALWWLYPPYGDTWGKAAVLHDYLYATQIDPSGSAIERKWADQVFLEAMKVLGAHWFRRTAMYQSVRWFGGRPWASYRKAIEAAKGARKVRDILNDKSS